MIAWADVYNWAQHTFRSKRTHMESQNRGLVDDIIKRLNECETRHAEETEARQRLEKQAARLEETVARMDAERAIAVIECDGHKQIVAWNRGAEKLFRWTEAEAIGRHINVILPPRHWKKSAELLEKAGAGNEAEDSTMFGLNREGDTMALRTNLHQYEREDGERRTVLEITLKRV